MAPSPQTRSKDWELTTDIVDHDAQPSTRLLESDEQTLEETASGKKELHDRSRHRKAVLMHAIIILSYTLLALWATGHLAKDPDRRRLVYC